MTRILLIMINKSIVLCMLVVLQIIIPNANARTWVKADLHVHGTVPMQPGQPLSYIPSASHQYSTSSKWIEKYGLLPTGIVPYNNAVSSTDINKVYDQATADWEYIAERLKAHFLELIVFVTHDFPKLMDIKGYTDMCANNGLICGDGSEERIEFQVDDTNRNEFMSTCTPNGYHIIRISEHSKLKIIAHPNAYPKDQLSPKYYEHRIAGTITGFELGTPDNIVDHMWEKNEELSHDQITAIEVYNGWMVDHAIANKLNNELITHEKDIQGNLLTPKDGKVFAINKWDAALSRGLHIYAVAVSDGFVKADNLAQLLRREEVRSDWEKLEITDPESKELANLASYVRSTPVGGGFIQVGIDTTKEKANFESLMDRINHGDFFAASRPLNIGPNSPIIKVIEVKMDPNAKWNAGRYNVVIENPNDVNCDAVTNYGRLFPMTLENGVFKEAIDTCDLHMGFPGQECSYIRVECRKCGDGVQLRRNCAHTWFQPIFFKKAHNKLAKKFAGIHSNRIYTTNQQHLSNSTNTNVKRQQLESVCLRPQKKYKASS